MRTVKQVSELTGISIRTLHYYDEIGLFKPSKVTESGYRMYDDDALQVLQQILFFRELDFPLKDIRAIMLNPAYDKSNAVVAQRKLIQVKRDRLNGLLNLLDKLIKGEKCMNFKEFDMSEYTNALEEFIVNNTDEILKYGGDLGDNYWGLMADGYLSNPTIIEATDKKYGAGASAFIGNALKVYWNL